MPPHSDPQGRYLTFEREIRTAIEQVFKNGYFILGPETSAFEDEFAGYLGIDYAIGVGSGTDAITLALVAAGIKPGDEVITVSLSAAATAVGIVNAGAIPRFVDVDPGNRCMDAGGLAAVITQRTAAVVPVHLHGFPAPMDEIITIAARNNLLVVEDCAQAHGAVYKGRRAGCHGHAAAFSFYPTKNLGAFGDGGAVVTGDRQIAERVRRLRQYGWDDRRVSIDRGFNSRLDEIQAAVLRILLPHLNKCNTERREIAAQYRKALSGLPLRMPPDDPGAVYHQFAVEIECRDEVQEHLLGRGIQTLVHYPLGIHQQKQFQRPGVELPVSEALTQRLLSLPIQPETAGENVAKICDALREGLLSCAR